MTMGLLYSLTCLLPVVSKLRGFRLWIVVIIASCVSLLMGTTQHWSLYHYYYGVKYFEQVGYFDLYGCSAWATGQTALFRRDLRTYEMTNEMPFCNLGKFSSAEWAEFQNDLRHDDRFHNGMMRDKGLNASPTHISIAKLFISWSPKLVVFLDWLVMILALTFAAYHVGLRKVGWALLWLFLFYGTVMRLHGHFLQWLWLSCLIVGMVQQSKRRAFGGFWMGISVTLMIFPLFLLIGRSRATLRWAAIGICIGLMVGLFTGRGLSVYPEFVQNMLIHSTFIRGELYNIGLLNAVTSATNDMQSFLVCFRGGACDIQPVVTAWIPYLLLIPFVIAAPFGLMFATITLSRYYYQILITIPLFSSEAAIRRLFLLNFVIAVWSAIHWDMALQYGGLLWIAYFAFEGVLRLASWRGMKRLCNIVVRQGAPRTF